MSHEFVWVRDQDTGHHYAVRDDAVQPQHAVLKSESAYAASGRLRRAEPKSATAGKSSKSEGK